MTMTKPVTHKAWREELLCLKEACENVLSHAYVPYSHFPVAAAARGLSGKIYAGCNIENASYGATCCAERVTIFQGIAQGEKGFDQLMLWTPKAEGYASPCGICRQVIAEFFAPEAKVYRLDQAGTSYLEVTVEELLPFAFEL